MAQYEFDLTKDGVVHHGTVELFSMTRRFTEGHPNGHSFVYISEEVTDLDHTETKTYPIQVDPVKLTQALVALNAPTAINTADKLATVLDLVSELIFF